MESNRWLAFSTLAVALVAAPLSLGCGAYGVVASDGCPTGEVCSTVTPGGLVFEGRSIGGGLNLFGTSLYPTAVGGRQTVTFRPARSSESLPPFSVRSTAPATLGLESTEGRSATVVGLADGSGGLEVIDETDDSLVDRIGIGAATVTSARLDVLDFVIFLADEPETPVAAFAGDADLFLHLVTADGGFAVDDDMVLGAGTTE
jgi:hypothetical protein